MPLDQSTFDFLFLVLIIITIAGLLWIVPVWLLLSFFTPKSLLEKYFKEPHFTLTETILMAQFPGFLIRTGIFGWLLVIPRVDRKRNIKNVKDYIPFWYEMSLKMFIVGSMMTFFLFLSLMAFLWFFKPSV
ncbi:MAG: hypothetical protein ACRBBR_09140 [Cellvibrionaceae bacterium]